MNHLHIHVVFILSSILDVPRVLCDCITYNLKKTSSVEFDLGSWFGYQVTDFDVSFGI